MNCVLFPSQYIWFSYFMKTNQLTSFRQLIKQIFINNNFAVKQTLADEYIIFFIKC